MKSQKLNLVIDIVLMPITFAGALVLRYIRKKGFNKTPISRRIFERMGIIPVIDYYYEPFYKKGKTIEVRNLPGINLNIEEQLKFLEKFNYNKELLELPVNKPANDKQFYYENKYFKSGDAEYMYNIIRGYKPENIIEIGSGYSTLIACKAIEQK
jgi:hypothetical protein